MADTTPDIIILRFLSQYGIGNYKHITHLLLSCFAKNVHDTKLSVFLEKQSIFLFLSEMQEHDFISYRVEETKEFGYWITAAIRPGGKKYLIEVDHGAKSIISITGNNNQVINQSSESSNKSLTAETTLTTPQTNSEKQKRTTTKSVVDIIKGVLAIGVSLTIIWKFFFPDIFNNKLPEVQKNNMSDSTINKSKDTVVKTSSNKKGSKPINKESNTPDKEKEPRSTASILILPEDTTSYFGLKPIAREVKFDYYVSIGTGFENPRILSDYDIQEIIKFAPSSTTKIYVEYLLSDTESFAFASQFTSKLNAYSVSIRPFFIDTYPLRFSKFELHYNKEKTAILIKIGKALVQPKNSN